MRLTTAIILLCTIIISTNAQMLDSANVWNILEVAIPICKKSTDCEGIEYHLTTYTASEEIIINNITYRKILNSFYFNNSDKPAAYMREEMNGKKIYGILDYPYDSVEILMYDFTLQKDSVFNSTYLRTTHMRDKDVVMERTFYKNTVIDVDSAFYRGKKRLRITFSDFRPNMIEDFQYNDTLYWIEGIGSNMGLLNYPSEGNYLLCFHQNNEINFTNKFGLGCDYEGPLESIENSTIENIQIYPNPLYGDILYIKSKSIIKNIRVFRMDGTTVYNYVFDSFEGQINCSDYQAGLYFIKMDDILKKFIIVHE